MPAQLQHITWDPSPVLANLKGISSQRIIFEILDAATVVAPAKYVILPWTFGTWE